MSFSTEVELSLTVPQNELRSARSAIEDSLSDIEIGTRSTASKAVSGGGGGGGAGGASSGSMARRSFRWERSRTEDISDILEILEDIEDSMGEGSGDDGGGNLFRSLGTAGGLIGGGLLVGGAFVVGAKKLIDVGAKLIKNAKDLIDVGDPLKVPAKLLIEVGALLTVPVKNLIEIGEKLVVDVKDLLEIDDPDAEPGGDTSPGPDPVVPPNRTPDNPFGGRRPVPAPDLPPGQPTRTPENPFGGRRGVPAPAPDPNPAPMPYDAPNPAPSPYDGPLPTPTGPSAMPTSGTEKAMPGKTAGETLVENLPLAAAAIAATGLALSDGPLPVGDAIGASILGRAGGAALLGGVAAGSAAGQTNDITVNQGDTNVTAQVDPDKVARDVKDEVREERQRELDDLERRIQRAMGGRSTR